MNRQVPEMLEPADALGTLPRMTGTPAPQNPSPGLSPRDRDLLDFERAWWQQQGPKERAIRQRFGFSAARYQQLLNRTIDLPEALSYDPMLVRRLLRLREQRRRRRVASRLGLPV
jgi:hypothetical protein